MPADKRPSVMNSRFDHIANINTGSGFLAIADVRNAAMLEDELDDAADRAHPYIAVRDEPGFDHLGVIVPSDAMVPVYAELEEDQDGNRRVVAITIYLDESIRPLPAPRRGPRPSTPKSRRQ